MATATLLQAPTSKSYASVSSATTSEARFTNRKKPSAVRDSNITAAKAVADAVRTSLGPRGMDKMIVASNKDVTITNDGATILKQMQLLHPVAKLLASLSSSQDVEAGDGTTTVVILAGGMLDAASKLLRKGIHPSIISQSFQKAGKEANNILQAMSKPVDLSDKSALLQSAVTSLSSKVVSQCSSLLAEIAVNAVLKVLPGGNDDTLVGSPSVNLKRVRIIKRLSGTIDDTELVEGLVLDQDSAGYGGPTRMEKAKVALIQFCISAPKTDIEHNVILSDHTQLDRALREERDYILEMIKGIKKSGCNVLLIQKSILRDAASELALHMLGKAKIMVVRDIERDDVESVCRCLGCRPIASFDHFKPDAFGYAELVERSGESTDLGRLVRFTGVGLGKKAVTVILHASNQLLLDEAERSLHDALCTIRCLVKQGALLPGGGAPEIQMAVRLAQYAESKLSGLEQYCVRTYAESMEIIPFTLAENAGLNSIDIITELRQRHANENPSKCSAGVSVRRGGVADMWEENVVQPLLVSSSAVLLATETIMQILKIDDFIFAAHM
ncbi:hypothetical protein GJ496_007386 [Pomphorhynchus laevis]|nr:hypothetical protein GJ496_007386 [Pomphorhynchus laevis]